MTIMGEESEQEQQLDTEVLASSAAAMRTERETLVNESCRRQEHSQELENDQERTGMEQLSSSRMAHLLAVYQNKVRDGKRAIARLKRQKDAQLQAVISQLLLLEAQLRREQKGIISQLAQRDHVIAAQRQEIDRLRRDNRRLINKLKKFSEVCMEAEEMEQTQAEPRLKVSRVESTEENMSQTKRRTNHGHSGSPTSRKSSSRMIRVATSVSELISSSNQTSFLKPQQAVCNLSVSNSSSQSHETVNPNVTIIRATTDRVFHKPPIAEKPRVVSRLARGQQVTEKGPQLVRSHGGKQCTIVSTISRLLEEESDATTTGGSGSSEPSSPEATLKPVTPRVIRLARQFEEGLSTNNLAFYVNQGSNDSSPETQRNDDSSSKSYIMDEYEVTSGYNSDAISDHEYENIRMLTQGSSDSPVKHDIKEDCKQEEEEEEDNYVILRAVKENHDVGNWVEVSEDQHIYSNVEFASGLSVKEVETEGEEESAPDEEENEKPRRAAKSSPHESEVQVLETNLDTLETSSAPINHLLPESLKVAMNVPRSRHNINLIMETDGDHMTENFEEFTLDSLELEEEQEDENGGRGKENLPVSEQRRCGDGAETKSDSRINEERKIDTSVHSAGGSGVMTNGQYEKFLEATGLSQKSILTPTRMFSNHRSVLKPRDIKQRNKLRAAFTTLSTLEESPGSAGSFRYWTEPYV